MIFFFFFFNIIVSFNNFLYYFFLLVPRSEILLENFRFLLVFQMNSLVHLEVYLDMQDIHQLIVPRPLVKYSILFYSDLWWSLHSILETKWE